MPNVTRSAYKTYKVAPDRRAIAKKESKDVMTKPVAVPLNHYMGMTFLATQDKSKLMNKLTKDATSVLDAYVETLEVNPLPAEVSPLELSPV